MCGLEGASVFELPHRDIVAVVSLAAAAQVPPTQDNPWLHEEVVEALMADRTVLPVRFGTVLANEAAVQAALETHYAELVADLKRLHGYVELGVRVMCGDDDGESQPRSADRLSANTSSGPQPAHGSGRAHLMARLAEEGQLRASLEQAEALAAELHAPLARLAAQSTYEVLTTPRLLLTAAYLVDRDEVAAFRRELEDGAISTAHQQLQFICTGPWPPYSFVTPAAPAGRREEE